MHANVQPFYAPLTPVWGQFKVKTFFRKKDCVAYHIIQLKCMTLNKPLAFWVGKYMVRH